MAMAMGAVLPPMRRGRRRGRGRGEEEEEERGRRGGGRGEEKERRKKTKHTWGRRRTRDALAWFCEMTMGRWDSDG